MHSRRKWLEAAFQRQWYRQTPGWSLAFAPLSGLLKGVAAWRYHRFRQSALTPPLPLLVVGNITVGGTGKTPVVIALCHVMKQKGLKPLVISRGYGSAAPYYPFVVTADSEVTESGDEPLLIAQRAGVPVIIDADRRAALQKALALKPDLIISDDGLQHYALPRTAELVVLDGQRGLGNGWCLPTGPLRESRKRLEQADWVLVNGEGQEISGSYRMQLQAQEIVNLLTGERRRLDDLSDESVVALAGIGHPERFFLVLEHAGAKVSRHPFPDHHTFCAADLAFDGRPLVIMTEKDAVKCRPFASDNHWYLPVSAELPDTLTEDIIDRLQLGNL